MTLLGLSTMELRQKIDADLASNPALELIPDRICPTCRRRLVASGSCPVCSRPQGLDPDQPIIFVSSRDDFSSGPYSSSENDTSEEDWTPQTETLAEYVLRQISPELLIPDRPIAAHILTNLDDDGLLQIPLLEICRFHHVSLSRVETVLRLIQRADPLGVGSPSVEQSLLVQLEVLSEYHEVPPLAARAIQEGMNLLSRRAYPELGKLLRIPISQAREIALFIQENLNPYPARSHWGENRIGIDETNAYRNPDIIISLLNNSQSSSLVVEIVSPITGILRVNPLFKQALAEAPVEKAEQWQTDLEQASLLVKCLQQRNHTIVRLMQRLSVLQRNFILHGDAYLFPVTRASLAAELEVHESTISRAVSGKAVQLPNGRIVPISKMFDRSLHVRTALRSIISQETDPLSDTQIAKLLERQGYPVARRTVAKYRAMEGILPARYRHHHFSPVAE
jgi:RNA polymerase sigma-54 factor